MSVKQANEDWEEHAHTFADKLAEAVRNGGCPKCGTLVGIIHEELDGTKFRQCNYCGNRYPVNQKQELKTEGEQSENGEV
jgi:DNA-directed RNA polymerase subunit M/transcription elongation factor TFIIS